MKKINIAIDGPAGAGKSTVAKLVAEKLSFIYIDTGAMYRALTWKALKDNVNIHNEIALVKLLSNTDISIQPDKKGQKVCVDHLDVTEEIRKREVTNHVSFVASYKQVRKTMLDMQYKLAENKGVVMDGRDIGTEVLPHAEVKIYLSASIEERATRRYLELKQKGEEQSLAELQEEIRKRDERDTNREFAPLKKASDAVEVDSTGLTIEEVVNIILDIIQQKIRKLD